MGCYDTVVFQCPNCGGVVEKQTEASKCNLETFEGKRGVPMSIAADIDGKNIRCSDCLITYEIISLLPLERIPFILMRNHR